MFNLFLADGSMLVLLMEFPQGQRGRESVGIHFPVGCVVDHVIGSAYTHVYCQNEISSAQSYGRD